jgi:phage gp29-like protein
VEGIALVVALALAGVSAMRGRKPAPPVYHVHRSAQRLGLSRPPPTPSSPPSGQQARDLLYDQWITHPGYGGATVQTILRAFRLAEAGEPQLQCDLFDDFLEPDCHLASLYEKRNEAVSGKPWVIQAGDHQVDDSVVAARVLTDAFVSLTGPSFIEVLQHLLTFNKYGWSAAEIDWGIREAYGRTWVVPVAFACPRARRFKISQLQLDGTQDELRLYADIARPRGDALIPGKWVTIRRDAAVPLACAGLMRNTIWPAFGKRASFTDWLKLSQRYGNPKPVARYEGSSDSEERALADEIVQNIGNDVGAVAPKSIDLDFFETKAAIDCSKIQGALCAYANAEMSKRVNGSTLSNDNAGSSGASYALGAVHDTVRWEAVQYDEGRVTSAFETQLFAMFMVYNGLAGVAVPKLHIQVVRDLDPGTRIDVATKYINLAGGKVARSQMDQELGFREPSGPDDTLPGEPQPPKVPQASPQPSKERDAA